MIRIGSKRWLTHKLSHKNHQLGFSGGNERKQKPYAISLELGLIKVFSKYLTSTLYQEGISVDDQ